jgi:dTDP-4-dehydrorhamnose 3,5-epimerase
MAVRPLRIAHCLEVTPVIHGDDRGSFTEWFRQDELAEHTGRRFGLLQANLSVSRRGVVRGIHFTDVPPGQAKYVMAVTGEIIDVAVDLRVGSPTFGEWDAVRLDDRARRAVFLPEGVGHGFAVLSESATVCYLTTDLYSPERERSLRPTDPRLAIEFGLPADGLVLSPKDDAAPSLDELERDGVLPRWEACLAVYEEAV